MTSDPSKFIMPVMASPKTCRWKKVASVQSLVNSSPRTPGIESTSTTHDIQSDFGLMDVAEENCMGDSDDVINRSERFHHRAASVDTGIPDNTKILTKRKLDEYTNSVKDDLMLGNRSSRQSSSENSNSNNNNIDNRILHVATRFHRPLNASSESSPIPADSDSPRRHKTLKKHSESNLSQRSYHSCCTPSSVSSSPQPSHSQYPLDDNFQRLMNELPAFKHNEVWVVSRRAHFLWKPVQGEPHDRLLLYINPCLAVDADFGVKLTHVPLLESKVDANGSKIYVRRLGSEVTMFVVRQSSDRHPLFHHPKNKNPQRTTYHRQSKLMDNFSWVEETLVIGSVQLKIALLLHEHLAKNLVLRPVWDHPVYSQYLCRPDEPSVPLRDDQGNIIFTDIRPRQLLGVVQKDTNELKFLLDCLHTSNNNTSPSIPMDRASLVYPQSPTPPNVLHALLRGRFIRPQIQGEVYKARVLKLNAAQNIWVPTAEEESLCLKVSCLSKDRVLTNEELNSFNSDLRQFRELIKNEVHNEDIIMDIITMQFFSLPQRSIPGFLQPWYVGCDGRHLFSATRFMPRGTLFDAFRKQAGRPFPLCDVQKIMRFVLRQVYCMHCKGLAHGDLFLDNILVKEVAETETNSQSEGLFANCEFLLMDFGQCLSTNPSPTTSSTSSTPPSTVSSSTSCGAPLSTETAANHETANQTIKYHIPEAKGKFVCFTPESIAVHMILKNPNWSDSVKTNIVESITCGQSLSLMTEQQALEKTDVWQLGIMLFMLLAGKEPFSMVAHGPQQTGVDRTNNAMGHEAMRREKLLSWLKMLHTSYRSGVSCGNDDNGSCNDNGVHVDHNSNSSSQSADCKSLRQYVVAMRQQSNRSLLHSNPLSMTKNVANIGVNKEEVPLPDQALSLLETMLCCDPQERQSVLCLLKHPFLTMSFTTSNETDNKNNDDSVNL